MTSNKTNRAKTNKGFFKPTISVPADLQNFVEQRKNEPQHAGNLSSYVRSLIIADRSKAATNLKPEAIK